MKTSKILGQILPTQFKRISIVLISVLTTACSNPVNWSEPETCLDPLPFPNQTFTGSGTGTSQRKANVDAKNNWKDQVRDFAPGYSKFKRSVDRTWTIGTTKNPHTSTVTARPCGKP